MMLKQVLIIAILGLIISCDNHQKDDVVFEDFESGTFDNWEIQGTAFDNPYLADTITDSLLKNSIVGSYFAYSNYDDLKLNQGELISPEFTIKHKYIDFLIGGGQHATRTCINLLIDNKIVRTQSGFGLMELRKASWDVTEYIDQNAILEIVDALYRSDTDLAYLLIDNIVFSNHSPRPTIIFDDFESDSYKYWQVNGNAFKTPGNRSNIYYPVTVNGFQGKSFAFSFGENHDKETGSLLSASFKINRNYISFLVGGGNHPDTTCIKLVIEDSIYYSSTGMSAGQLRKEVWDVSNYLGMAASIEILDNYSGNWGHIIVDDIRFIDVLDEDEITSVYYFKLNNLRPFKIIFAIIIGALVLIILSVVIKRKTKQDSIPGLNSKDLKKQVDCLFEENKVYLNSELTANTIAQKLDVSTKELLKIIESIYKMPFNDMVNEYRVKCFKQEVTKSKNKELKLVAIAEKCGFNSKSSFYRIFKKHTNLTPTEYLQKIKEK
ncbi:helix-turn-helix domain-containing protein [Bacteroidales bacterium]|nr:helix-turn-helix domain-containing protein [Bacteroidales bacterium]